MSETQALTLTDFLLARIAEDEAVARSAGGEEWYPCEVPPLSMRKREDDETHICIDSPRTLIAPEIVSDEMAQHIARHDPARVLAECEVKRRIVAACEPIYGTDGWEYDDAPELAWTTLRALALPYADHPDFREEWRP